VVIKSVIIWYVREVRAKNVHSPGTHQLPPWCPSFLRLPLLCHFWLYTCDLLTWPLSHTCRFPVHHTLKLFSCLSCRPVNLPLFRTIRNSCSCLSWFTLWSCETPAVSFCFMASQWQLRSTLPFSSLYNLKFWASRLLGLPFAFTLLSCLAYSTLEMEAVCPSETSLIFQGIGRCYISEDSTLNKLVG
jgi:hypothetical protein